MNREDVELSPWKQWIGYDGELGVCRDIKIYHKFGDLEKYKITLRFGEMKFLSLLEIYDYAKDSGVAICCKGFEELLNKAEEEIYKIIDAMYDER